MLANPPGSEAAAIAAGTHPRQDYIEIARDLGARFVGPPDAVGAPGPFARLPGDWEHAWAARRTPAAAVLALGESVGVPLAVVKPRGSRLVMVAHALTRPRPRRLQQLTHLLHRVDRFVVVSGAQERYLREEVGLPADRVRFMFDSVDHEFFAPRGDDSDDDGYVLSVGAEQRDYATLVAAVRRLGVPAVFVPSSRWVTAALIPDLPSGVTIREAIPFLELRELYERAAAVVVAVRPGTQYAAGVNGLLEGMAMRKPVVVTETPGLAEYLDDGISMRTVPAGDPAAMAETLGAVLGDRATGRRLAGNARAAVEAGRGVDRYVRAVTEIVRELGPSPDERTR